MFRLGRGDQVGLVLELLLEPRVRLPVAVTPGLLDRTDVPSEPAKIAEPATAIYNGTVLPDPYYVALDIACLAALAAAMILLGLPAANRYFRATAEAPPRGARATTRRLTGARAAVGARETVGGRR